MNDKWKGMHNGSVGRRFRAGRKSHAERRKSIVERSLAFAYGKSYKSK